MIASAWGGSEGGFSSLDGVASLFANRWLLLAGWTHYLAFDLLVGVWEVHDSRERGIPHLLVVPCLALTFMFGPAGWLLYQLIRRVRVGSESASRLPTHYSRQRTKRRLRGAPGTSEELKPRRITSKSLAVRA